MKKSLLPIVVLVLTGFLFSFHVGVCLANTATGHVSIAIATLIDMTENSGKYADVHKNTGNRLILKKGSEGKYDLTNLTSEQKAFILGTIAPDGKFKLGLFSPDEDYVADWHYISPQDRVASIFENAKNKTDEEQKRMDYAFGYGTVSHITADLLIHPLIPQALQVAPDETLVRDSLSRDGNYWRHVALERVYDNKVLRAKVVAEFGPKSNTNIKDIIDGFVTTMGPLDDTGEISKVDGYDVYGKNAQYYLDVYLKKCPMCGKKLEKAINPYTDRTNEINAILEEKKRSNSELLQYADLAISAAKSLGEKHNNYFVKTYIQGIAEAANIAKSNHSDLTKRDDDKKAIDKAIYGINSPNALIRSTVFMGLGDNPVVAMVQAYQTYLTRFIKSVIFNSCLSKLKEDFSLPTIIAAHQEAFQSTTVKCKNLDDGTDLPSSAYKYTCNCQETKQKNDKKSSNDPGKTGDTGNSTTDGTKTNKNKTPSQEGTPKSRGLLRFRADTLY